MSKQVVPVLPAIPSTTAIVDPAARRFAQAVEQALAAIQTAGGALRILEKAAQSLADNPAGTPPAVADWLFKSDLYRKLSTAIARIDVEGMQSLAEEWDAAVAYEADTVVRRGGTFYRALQDSTGVQPPNTTYWETIGQYSSLGPAVAGLMETERTTRTTNDEALVAAVNAAWSVTGATNALIQSGGRLQTNWTAGQADQWNQLQLEVFGAGGNTIRAALAEESTLRANADGQFYGQWTIKLDVNGYVAGIGLASESSEAGAGTSAFVIRADKLAMVMPGYGEHVPFAIGPAGATFNGLTDWGNVQNKTGFASISQITQSNVATFIANAAIGAAQIGSIALVGVGNFSVKSSTVGERTEMDSRAIKVFDANGVVRVQMGNLTV